MRAAAGHLVFVDGKEPFNRNDLYQTMQAAKVYKKSFTNALSTNVTRMINGNELIENSTDNFSLSENLKSKILPSLSGG